MIAALTAKPLDIASAERKLGLQQISGFRLATDSEEWLASHR
jgi:hypothetical protein